MNLPIAALRGTDTFDDAISLQFRKLTLDTLYADADTVGKSLSCVTWVRS
jgi:hypothetical protein